MITMTAKQIDAIHARLFATCAEVHVRRWDTTGRFIEVSQSDRQRRLIETVKIAPGGKVTVLP